MNNNYVLHIRNRKKMSQIHIVQVYVVSVKLVVFLNSICSYCIAVPLFAFFNLKDYDQI